MATKKITVLVCDICDDGETEAEGKPVRMDIDGEKRDVDMCGEHKAEYKRLGQRVQSKVPAHANGHRRRSRRRPNPSVVREWALGAGYDVKAKGRVPAEVVDAYAAAN